MTALLEPAVAQARQLPDDKQDAFAERFLQILAEVQQAEPEVPKKARKAGSAKGQGYMTADFDEPLEDFKDYI